ncbi:MAG: ChaN family lipoprotein [Terrimicrobiaceae bacterium]
MRRAFACCAVLGALAWTGCATRQPASPARPSHLSLRDGWEAARIVYIGEKHDEASHHRFEEKVLHTIHGREKTVTVGMEMVDVTQQAALDEYLGKQISWNEFVNRTAFDRGWGKTSPAYKRILSWCRNNAVPVLALNAPPAVTRKLARNEPLTAEEAKFIPTDPGPPGGFKRFTAEMAGHGAGASLRLYYKAQRAWDQTMAGRILDWLPEHPGTLVVLLGRFHADPRTGVPWYVAKKSRVKQIVLYPEQKQEQ